jgi:hypothetical protein
MLALGTAMLPGPYRPGFQIEFGPVLDIHVAYPHRTIAGTKKPAVRQAKAGAIALAAFITRPQAELKSAQ